MRPPKTIIIDDAIPFAKAMFAHLGVVKLVPGKQINANTVQHADALIIRSRTRINQALLHNSAVKFVGSTVVGLDHIDQTYLNQTNRHFYSAQGCNANSVAEYIMTCLLILAEKHQFDLTQKTLGIIGVGHVGSLVLKKAQALGMTCLLNDPPKVQQNPQLAHSANAKNALYTNLEHCLSADIITVHTPLTTHGQFATLDLLSAKRLKRIQPHQILINAARGGIINETAWQQTNTLANIIDCWVNEPNINAGLYKKADIATPHIAGHALDAKITGTQMVYQALCAFWNTPPQTQWQQNLPNLPSTLNIDSQQCVTQPATQSTTPHSQHKPCTNLARTLQTQLTHLTQTTHNPLLDDQAIRSVHIETVHQKYEDYRRNFPVYREWHQHNVHVKNNLTLRNILIKMGFNAY